MKVSSKIEGSWAYFVLKKTQNLWNSLQQHNQNFTECSNFELKRLFWIISIFRYIL